MKVKLSDGFEVTIDDSRLNDWNLLKMLRTIDKGDASLIVDVAEALLGGEENADALANHFEKDGIVPLDAMMAAISEIIESASELKNSSPSPA